MSRSTFYNASSQDLRELFLVYCRKALLLFPLLGCLAAPLRGEAADDDPSYITYGGELSYRFHPGLKAGIFGDRGLGNQVVISGHLGRMFFDDGKTVLKVSGSYGPYAGGRIWTIDAEHKNDPDKYLSVPMQGDAHSIMGRLGVRYYFGNAGAKVGGGVYFSMGVEANQMKLDLSLDASEKERSNYKVSEDVEGNYKLRYFFLDLGVGYEWEVGPGHMSVQLDGGVTLKEPPFGAPDWEANSLTLDQQLLNMGTYIGPKLSYRL